MSESATGFASLEGRGVTLAWDSFGDADDPTLLLVGGLTQQLVEWDPDLCGRLASAGLHVVRYDHRDAGLSTKLDDLGRPDIAAVSSGAQSPPYTLDDLAADAVGFLDHLGVERAHIFGTSMGGMVAQLVAIGWPSRVASLISAQSTCGDRAVTYVHDAAVTAFESPPQTAQERIDDTVETWRWMAGPHYGFDAERARRRATAKEARCWHPDGRLRQLAAMAASGDRSAVLRHLSVPALVLHGGIDPVIDVEGARLTAAAIPGAQLQIYPLMGHGFPEELWDDIVAVVSGHVAAAEAGSGSGSGIAEEEHRSI